MKKLIFSLCLSVMILLSFTFAGCNVAHPYDIKWYLDAYYDYEESIQRYVGFDNYDHFGSVMSDCAQISFNKDGSFYFKDKDGEKYNGTYKSRKTSYDVEITLTFPDGTTAGGSYSELNSDEANYFAMFDIFGVKYYFNDRERNFNEDNFKRCLAHLKDAICTYATDGRMDAVHYPYYEGLKRAEIGKIGDSFIAVTKYNSYLLNNASYWCYAVNSEEIRSCELKEGDCIIRSANGFFAIYYPEIDEQ